MKRLILISLVLVTLPKSFYTQIVFCPPGAQWNYAFTATIWSPDIRYNETIKLVKDSVSGADTIKVLSHSRFEEACGARVNRTLIKQKGDTIFFQNWITQNTWQILYNFGAAAGQSWKTNLVQKSSLTSYTAYVNSVQSVTVNGFPLKRLSVTITPGHWGTRSINERLGADRFLFVTAL